MTFVVNTDRALHGLHRMCRRVYRRVCMLLTKEISDVNKGLSNMQMHVTYVDGYLRNFMVHVSFYHEHVGHSTL